MKNAMDILNDKGSDITSVPESATIRDALEIMKKKNIGSIVIKNKEKISGIWTERDLLHQVTLPDFSLSSPIADYMTKDIVYVDKKDSLYKMLDMFLGLRLRHVLVKDKDGIAGILSVGDVMKASLNEKNKELQDLNAMVSWEYYENWRW